MTILAGFLMTLSLSAQKVNLSKDYKAALKEAGQINYYLELNEAISPFLDAEQVAYVFDDYEKFSPTGEAYEIIDSCNTAISVLLPAFLENEKYASFQPDTMVHTTKLYSPDKHLVIHNWYANNGGTFMMHHNFLQTNMENGNIEVTELDYLGEFYETGILFPCGSTCYYLIGNTKNCATCIDYSVFLFQSDVDGTYPIEGFVSNELVHDSSFGFTFRNWDLDHNYISYNEIDNSFEYAITNDDAYDHDVYYEEGKWVFDGTYFQHEIVMQLERKEFVNLNGGSDNN